MENICSLGKVDDRFEWEVGRARMETGNELQARRVLDVSCEDARPLLKFPLCAADSP